MPLEHRQLYVSTTLLLVIFTTIICGGLTEPMLSKMGMRNNTKEDEEGEGEGEEEEGASPGGPPGRLHPDDSSNSPSNPSSAHGLLKTSDSE
jgi:hypothetical protein